MPLVLLAIAIALLLLMICIQLLQLKRGVALDLSPINQMFLAVEKSQERTERGVQEEIAKNRQESLLSDRQSREEMGNTLRALGEALALKLETTRQTVEERLQFLQEMNTEKLGTMRETIELRLTALQENNGKKLDQVRQENAAAVQKVREEVAIALNAFGENITKSMDTFGGSQRSQLSNLGELLSKLTESNEKKLEGVRITVEEKLKALQEDNAKSLDQMRQTVDEKLQGTLEKRLGESFKLVSERLEQVHKGLGEMQNLATGVGDLKRVLTNVKTRGTWGEVQLGALLQEVLSPEQFEANVATKESAERVEFAIKLPGRGIDQNEVLYLPIDAKFPVEDYQRLVEAQERADPEAAEAAARQLELRIKHCAADICAKYINPPKTTDFAIMFLPTEGLFAEVLRRTGLPEVIQRDCRVVIAGPTTLWSILSSFQMGFKTLTIQKRSSEVWNLLGAVKLEFTKYGDVLRKVQNKLHEASDTIDKEVAVRTRAIQRKLRGIEEPTLTEATNVLALDLAAGDGELVDETN
jgi:DNA recombination protein RmuC